MKLLSRSASKKTAADADTVTRAGACVLIVAVLRAPAKARPTEKMVSRIEQNLKCVSASGFVSRKLIGKVSATTRLVFATNWQQSALNCFQAAMRLTDAFTSRLTVTPRCARLFRGWVGAVVVLDCIDRWESLEWLYSDSGALPRDAVLPPPHEDRLLWAVCAHAWHGSLAWVRALVVLEACAAVAFGCGVRWCGALAWWLHISICVRAAPLIYILDRYLHLLLLYATALPTPHAGGEWSIASLAIALQVVPASCSSLATPLCSSIYRAQLWVFAEPERSYTRLHWNSRTGILRSYSKLLLLCGKLLAPSTLTRARPDNYYR